MAYSALTDLIKLIPETMIINLSNDIAGATTVNQENVDEAIDQADREIDGFLLIAGESVPVNPVPPLISNLSMKMAIWNLHLRKYFDSAVWEKTYERCVKILEKIAEGKMTIGQEDENETQVAGNGFAVSTREQKFTERMMRTF
jgi:phage gp36-like protein